VVIHRNRDINGGAFTVNEQEDFGFSVWDSYSSGTQCVKTNGTVDCGSSLLRIMSRRLATGVGFTFVVGKWNGRVPNNRVHKMQFCYL
jgi:hypothetical protein